MAGGRTATSPQWRDGAKAKAGRQRGKPPPPAARRAGRVRRGPSNRGRARTTSKAGRQHQRTGDASKAATGARGLAWDRDASRDGRQRGRKATGDGRTKAGRDRATTSASTSRKAGADAGRALAPGPGSGRGQHQASRGRKAYTASASHARTIPKVQGRLKTYLA